MLNKGWKRHALLLCGTASIALATASITEAAEAAKFDIPSQPLSTALAQFGVQSQQGVFADSTLTSSKTTRGVSGAKDAEVALNELLAGTGLSWRREGQAFVIVQGGSADPQGGSAAGDGAGTVEALIVTAQKREEDIQDVPIAISAFTQEDLTRSQIAGGPDLITQVPNMTFTKTNFSSYSIQLRGIGTQAISATTDPGVAVAFNNTPFIRNRFFEQEFYDLQRVEVLRGPQGTLYGRNATAGVVNIISAKPKFIAESKLSGDLGNYSSSRIEGMVNIPLVEDQMALRLAGAWTKRDGYAFNELTGAPIDGRDLWSTRLSLRFAPTDTLDVNLIWEHFEEDDDRLRSGKQLCKKDVVTEVGGVPVTDYYMRLQGGGQTALWSGVQATLSQGCTRNSLYARDSFQRPSGLMLPYYVPLGAIGLPTALQDPYVSVVDSSNPAVISATNDQPEDLRIIQSTIDPSYRAKADIAEIQINVDVSENLTFTSETGYGADTVHSLQDFNRFNTAPGAWGGGNASALAELVDRGVLRDDLGENLTFCDPQLGCSDRVVAVDISTAEARQFSQEFRLSSDFDGPVNFSLGSNFLRADSEDKYYVFINSLSLIAARGRSGSNFPPYVGGETDNLDCMFEGAKPGDPDGVYEVARCVYMDPNPIESLNDQGHNYFLSKNPYKLISYAAFGELYWNVSDALKVTGGLRYTVDKKEAPRIPTWILASNSVGYPVADVIEQEWREPTGRLTVDWKPELAFTDETMLYASYSHGYKAGGANPPGYVKAYYGDEEVALAATQSSATRPRTFDAEFVDAFEIGSKNVLADGKVTLNLAAFYYDYKDYQISEIVDRSAFNRNFDAEVWGAEVEADWRPLENLRLGFKGGYQKTRIADGERAIDLMDRTAGNEDWVIVRPFPTYASSCVFPVDLFVGEQNNQTALVALGGVGGGGMGGCEEAYLVGNDPVTRLPYVPNPTVQNSIWGSLGFHPGYPGFDPSTAPNNGEGFFKELGGNELPNAPNWTATITADYTVPLPNDWLATLHTDLHWQSESWWRVFNDHEFSRLDEYFTMNLAAIFTNEEAGWNVMAYIKNVTDETAITGAFLNSDDTGLTTNVFLTEPRLYGLRVTKAWHGGPLLGSFGERRDGPYPFTLELGGQVQTHDAPYDPLQPTFATEFSPAIDIFASPQNQDLDRGDGRSIRLTWRPDAGPWRVSAGVRYGRTNGGDAYRRAEEQTDPACAFGGPFAFLCTKYADDPDQAEFVGFQATNWTDAWATNRERHQVVDFEVGRDVGLGFLQRSSVTAGLRHARLTSSTAVKFDGIPDWTVPEGWFLPQNANFATHNRYGAEIDADRETEAFGPMIAWEAFFPLLGGEDEGRAGIEWSFAGGALFGKQKAEITGVEQAEYYRTTGQGVLGWRLPTSVEPPSPIEIRRSERVTVPVLDLSLGLSYSLDRMKIGAGYRWERYFDALDVGFDEHQDGDRTIDGPYFKLSVGFGG